MKDHDELKEEMYSIMMENDIVHLGERGDLDGYRSASKECADVAIKYAIDVLRDTDYGFAAIQNKISELQSLLKQPQP